MGLNSAIIQDYVFKRLGDGITKVELSSLAFPHFIQNALDKYSRYRPRIYNQSVTAVAGKQVYTSTGPNPDITGPIGYGVVDVRVPTLDPIAPLLLSAGPKLDIFGYRYSYPYRDLSELEIDYTYFSLATRELSSEVDWDWTDDGNLLFHPAPVETFNFLVVTALEHTIDTVATNPGQAIATGNGTSTTFQYTVPLSSGQSLSQFSILITVSGDSNNANTAIQDDGNGNLAGTGGYGTVNYSTGNISVTFLVPPSSGSSVMLAYSLIVSQGTLFLADYDWIKDFCLAQAKEAVGFARRKFRTIPGANVETQLDGVELVDEGQKMQSELLEVLHNRHISVVPLLRM